MIDPRFMTAIEWTDRMALILRLPVYRLTDENEWRDWAEYVLSFPQISVFNPPDPGEQDDWREWAERFNQTVQLN